jgi:hypothetical protein
VILDFVILSLFLCGVCLCKFVGENFILVFPCWDSIELIWNGVCYVDVGNESRFG